MSKCILIKPKEKQVEEVQITDFHEILEAINSRVFDVVSRQIGINDERVYTIYVDDEGLLKDDPQVSAWGATDNSTLVGDILVSKTDRYGEMVDLSEDDIEYIKSHCHTIINIEGGEEVTALFPVFYPTRYN